MHMDLPNEIKSETRNIFSHSFSLLKPNLMKRSDVFVVTMVLGLARWISMSKWELFSKNLVQKPHTKWNVERKHQYILNVARALPFKSNFLKVFG